MVKHLEKRIYQIKLVNVIKKSKEKGKNVLLELDAGLGKRIISYLLYRDLSQDERVLMITPTTSSLEGTVSTFKKLKKVEEQSLGKLGYLYGKTRGKIRKPIFKESQFLIATPITLTHTIKKIKSAPKPLQDFDYLLLNEVDKIVRRTAKRKVAERRRKSGEQPTFTKATDIDSRDTQDTFLKPLFTYPWNYLRDQIPESCCVVGMSATLKDKHMVKEGQTGKFKPELKTIIQDFLPNQEVKVVEMTSLMKSTDLDSYLPENISLIRPISVSDPNLQEIANVITQKMETIREKIYEEYPKLFEEKDFEHVKKGFSLLPSDSSLKKQFFKFSLYRKFVIASVPHHYKKFINHFPDKRERKRLNSLIPKKSQKVQKIVDTAKQWIKEDKKVAVMVSYIKTALSIRNKLQDIVDPFLITGETYERSEILSAFKESETGVLLLTPVGGRDLDLKTVDLLIIHDVVNTVKTVYQRLKRARGALVIFLYYQGTHEKLKVLSILDTIQKRYPWTTRMAT